MKKPHTVIIGAGVAGLAAAWGLSEKGHKVTIVEKMNHVGGLAATFKWKQYPLDLGPHKFYTILPGILTKIKKLVGKDMLKRPKTSKIRLFGNYFDYPIEIKNLILKMGPLNALKFAWSFGWATLLNFTGREPKNSAEYFQFRYGSAAYQMVFRPLSNKIWGNPEKLDVNLARTRVPAPTIFQLISGLLFGTKNQKEVSADHFHYPRKGIGQMADLMLKKAKKKGADLVLSSQPKKIKHKNGLVQSIELDNGKTLTPDYLISTIHLKHLIPLFTPKAPKNIQQASQSLKHRSLILLFLEFNQDRILDDSWSFFPEKKFIFNRLSEMKSFNPKIHPKNKTVLMVEMTCEFDDKRWNTQKEALVNVVIKDLKKADLIDTQKPVDSLMIKIGHGYPVYDLKYKQNLNKIIDYLEQFTNFYTIGRPGLFFYDNTDHSIDMGLNLSEHITKGHSQKHWRKQLDKFFTYKIVD